jgi:hypothetical protein
VTYALVVRKSVAMEKRTVIRIVAYVMVSLGGEKISSCDEKISSLPVA